jgi:hypothetical protein
MTRQDRNLFFAAQRFSFAKKSEMGNGKWEMGSGGIVAERNLAR